MSRPMLLVFLLLVLIITSQFEWKQQLVSDVDSSPTVSQKQQQISKREEGVKEKAISICTRKYPLFAEIPNQARLVKVLRQIILSQEKNIQKLNELVRSLREQLRQCMINNETTNNLSSLADNVIELEPHQILED